MATSSLSNGWLVSMRRIADPKLRLFCFHHAGGSASFCSGWARHLPVTVEILSVQLPGREQRFAEPFITGWTALIHALLTAFKGHLHVPFATFGHSMGALVSYELSRELQRQGMNQPRIFFASGRQAPQFPEKEPAIHHLPDQAFCAEFLRRPDAKNLAPLFADPDARQVFLPQIKADMQLAESYKFAAKQSGKLACPVIALDCRDEGCIEEHELVAWGGHTAGGFRCYRFPGDHFFIESAQAQVLAVVRDELAPFLS